MQWGVKLSWNFLSERAKQFSLVLIVAITIAGCGGCASAKPMSPELLTLSKQLRDQPRVAAGDRFVLAVKDGKVYGWGTNGKVLIDKEGRTPSYDRPVIIPIPAHVVSVSAGMEHAVALTKDGDVWTWGSNLYGAMGIEQFKNNPKRPSWASPKWNFRPFKVKGLPKIVKIAASGSSHALALTKGGDVWTWGSAIGTRVANTNRTKIATPYKVNGLPVIADIYTGTSMSIVISNMGDIYVWGDAFNNNFPFIENGMIKSPKKIDGSICRIMDVDTGSSSVFVCQNGHVKAIGFNYTGALGLGDRLNKSHLENNSYLRGTIKVTGENPRIALSRSGELKGWGHSKYGVPEWSNQYVLKPVDIKFKRKAIDITSFHFNAYVIGSNGLVYKWISNESWLVNGLYDFLSGYKFVPLKYNDGSNFQLFNSKEG